MKTRWYEREPGHTSAMRIIAMGGAAVGAMLCIAGGVAMFLGLPDAVQIAGIGAGLFGVGEIAKAWQRQGE